MSKPTIFISYSKHDEDLKNQFVKQNESRYLVEAIKLPRRNSPEDNIAEAFTLSYNRLEDDLKLVFQSLGLCAQSGAPAANEQSFIRCYIISPHDKPSENLHVMQKSLNDTSATSA